MWLWPAVRMTIMWSAPCQAAMRMRRMSSSKRPRGDLGRDHAVGLRVDVVEVVGRRQRDAALEALRRLLVAELVQLLVGHLLAPVPALAPRPVALEALEQRCDVELLVGLEGRTALAHRRPSPLLLPPSSQPVAGGEPARGLGHGGLATSCCSAARRARPRAPAGRASRTRRRQRRRSASRRPCASARERSIDGEVCVRASSTSGSTICWVSSQNRASSCSSVRPARCPRTSRYVSSRAIYFASSASSARVASTVRRVGVGVGGQELDVLDRGPVARGRVP